MAKGKADSYKGSNLSIGLSLPIQKGLFFRFGHTAENFIYQEIHPIFNITRKDTNEGLLFMAKWNISNHYSINFIMNQRKINSNIDFFDSETTTAIASLIYSF